MPETSPIAPGDTSTETAKSLVVSEKAVASTEVPTALPVPLVHGEAVHERGGVVSGTEWTPAHEQAFDEIYDACQEVFEALNNKYQHQKRAGEVNQTTEKLMDEFGPISIQVGEIGDAWAVLMAEADPQHTPRKKALIEQLKHIVSGFPSDLTTPFPILERIQQAGKPQNDKIIPDANSQANSVTGTQRQVRESSAVDLDRSGNQEGKTPAGETTSHPLRDYTEKDLQVVWDRIPKSKDGVEQKIAIVREQVERAKTWLQVMQGMGAYERLTHRLSQLIQVDSQVLERRATSERAGYETEIKTRVLGLAQRSWRLTEVQHRLKAVEEHISTDAVAKQDLTFLMLTHFDLHRLLVALEQLVEETHAERTREVPGQLRKPEETHTNDNGSKERRHIPFRERLAIARQLIGEWKALVQASGEADGVLRQRIATRLGKDTEAVLDVREFERELRKLGAKDHHWQGPGAIGDKQHVKIRIKHLEELLVVAREVTTINKPQTIDHRKEEGTGDVTGETMGDREFGPVATSLELEKTISGLVRKDKELWYRDQTGNLYRVIPTRGDTVFELWYPDGIRVLGHYRKLVDRLSQIGVVFDGKRTLQKDDFQDPKLQSLTGQEVQSVVKQASGVVLREREKAVSELEQALKGKLQSFVQLMNEKLQEMEPGLSYARRRSRIFAQMPEFAELILRRQNNTVLSSNEEEAMIEKYTRLIEMPK